VQADSLPATKWDVGANSLRLFLCGFEGHIGDGYNDGLEVYGGGDPADFAVGSVKNL
jgi:hypothetical protein